MRAERRVAIVVVKGVTNLARIVDASVVVFDADGVLTRGFLDGLDNVDDFFFGSLGWRENLFAVHDLGLVADDVVLDVGDLQAPAKEN